MDRMTPRSLSWIWPRNPVKYEITLADGRVLHKKSYAVRTSEAWASTYERFGRTYIDIHPYTAPHKGLLKATRIT